MPFGDLAKIARKGDDLLEAGADIAKNLDKADEVVEAAGDVVSKVDEVVESGGDGYDFALGLSKHPGHTRGGLVGRFSEHVGGRTYWDLFENTTDMRTMGENILKGMDASKQIHFNLDGMLPPGTTIEDLSRWGSEGIGQGNVTNWELHQILSNPNFRSKATFYLGGKPVDIGGL